MPVEVDGVKINMPNCCPNEPQHGKPFCKEHSEKLKTLGVPGDLLGFIKHFKEHAAAQKSSILGMCQLPRLRHCMALDFTFL